MNVKQLIGTILDTVIKIAIIAVVVTYTYRYAMQVYEFGYRISAEEPVSSAEAARLISISVTEDATVMDIGEVLEDKGMIRDARLFYIQELLSVYHDKLKPGVYELSSDMTAKEMLAVMSAEPIEEEEETEAAKTDKSAEEDKTASEDDEGTEDGETPEDSENEGGDASGEGAVSEEGDGAE